MNRLRYSPARAVIVVEAILVFVLLAMNVKEFVVYRFSPGALVSSEGAGAGTDAMQKNLFAYEKVVSSGLFGADALSLIDLSFAKAEKGSATAEAMPEVTLIGTVVDAQGAGFAVFEDKRTKRQEISVIGEAVFGAGILSKLEEKRAFIQLGKRELVYDIFEKKLESGGSDTQTVGRPVRAIGRSLDAGNNADISKISQKTGEGEYIIDQRALNSVLSDIGKVLTDARLVPYIENGAVTGFVINEMKPGGVFSLIGLQEGDILKKINNFEINSPEKGVQLLSGLKGESNLNVEVVRNGQPISLHYQIR